jgi:putative N-acetylmannosamine-6-phosphate epimerase
MADVSTLEEGIAAAAAGAAWVGTTLSGYTPDTASDDGGGPDFGLVAALAAEIPGAVIAEGRIWTPEEAAEAMRLGAHAVVVGTAITRPVEIVRRFVAALEAAG